MQDLNQLLISFRSEFLEQLAIHSAETDRNIQAMKDAFQQSDWNSDDGSHSLMSLVRNLKVKNI